MDALFNRFIDRIEELERVTPMLATLVGAYELKHRREASAYFTSLPDGKLDIQVATEALKRAKDSRQHGQSYDITLKCLFIGAFSLYDAFVHELLTFLFRYRTDLTILNGKSLTYEEILGFSSFEELRSHLVTTEVESVLRESHADQLKRIGNLFDIKLGDGVEKWPEFIEASQRRNLIVHTDGKVSQQYLDICGAAGFPWESIPKLGDRLDVARKYLLETYSILDEVGMKLGQALCRKVLPDWIEQCDTYLNNRLYTSITEDRLVRAVTIGKYAMSLPRYSNDESKRRLAVNYAQALKWLNRPNDCNEVLDRFDWSASGDNFNLVVCVLKDDYKRATELVRNLSWNSDWKFNLLEWPVFREFRKSDAFRDVYTEVYGETLGDTVAEAKSQFDALGEALHGLIDVLEAAGRAPRKPKHSASTADFSQPDAPTSDK